MSSNMFFASCSLFSFWDPYNANINMLDVVSEVSQTVISFHPLFCSVSVISTVFQLADLFLCVNESTVDSV